MKLTDFFLNISYALSCHGLSKELLCDDLFFLVELSKEYQFNDFVFLFLLL